MLIKSFTLALLTLIVTGCASLRIESAKNGHTPQIVLSKLASDSDIDVRRWVAYNSQTPPESLTKLAADPDPTVQETVFVNPNTPLSVFRELATKWSAGSRNERLRVARNAKTPMMMMAKLAADPDSLVRITVAMNPNTSPPIIANLATDLDRSVRYLVAMHPNTPFEALRMLVRDRDARVHKAAFNRIAKQH